MVLECSGPNRAQAAGTKSYAHRVVLARLDGAVEVLLGEDLEGLGPQLAAGLAVRLLVRPVRGRVSRRARGVAHHQSLGEDRSAM